MAGGADPLNQETQGATAGFGEPVGFDNAGTPIFWDPGPGQFFVVDLTRPGGAAAQIPVKQFVLSGDPRLREAFGQELRSGGSGGLTSFQLATLAANDQEFAESVRQFNETLDQRQLEAGISDQQFQANLQQRQAEERAAAEQFNARQQQDAGQFNANMQARRDELNAQLQQNAAEFNAQQQQQRDLANQQAQQTGRGTERPDRSRPAAVGLRDPQGAGGDRGRQPLSQTRRAVVDRADHGSCRSEPAPAHAVDHGGGTVQRQPGRAGTTVQRAAGAGGRALQRRGAPSEPRPAGGYGRRHRATGGERPQTSVRSRHD